jgi:hypothetical protein
VKKIKNLLISMGLIVLGVSTVTGQDTADYFLGHGFAGTGDTVFTNSGTFWDDGYTSNYDQDADWDYIIARYDPSVHYNVYNCLSSAMSGCE